MSFRGFAGVLGWPLERTLSPAIHNAAFRRLGLDWVYLAFPVAPEDLGAAVGGLRALNAMGANVTMPHKETVIAHLDDLSGDARSIGAVNTIQRLGDKLIGHNTDVDGFAEFLALDAGVDPGGRRCLVLGAGGAARAVVRALARSGAGSIAVAARDEAKARAVLGLAEPVPSRWVPFDRAVGEDADLVVNATPLGAKGEDPLAGATFTRDHVVVDLLYSPPTTPLMRTARSGGAAAWGGLGMLVAQAASALRIWTGQDPPTDVMSAAAMRAIVGQ